MKRELINRMTDLLDGRGVHTPLHARPRGRPTNLSWELTMGKMLQFKRNDMAERRENLIDRWVSFQERVTLALVSGTMSEPLCMLFEQELELLEAELGLLQQDMEGRRVQ